MRIAVIGQGMAGTLAGWALCKRGHEVTWFDNPERSQASRIASGLYNPVVLKRMRIVHLAEEMLEYIVPVYQALEDRLQVKFFYPTPIQRIFHSVREENDWNSKSGSAPWSDQLSDGCSLEGLLAPFGTGTVSQSGWVNTKLLLEQFRESFSAQVVTTDLHTKDIFFEPKVRIFDENFDAVVFAEGWRASLDNPYYPKDVFRPSKGELLSLRIEGLPDDLPPIHYSHFLLPGVEAGTFRTGATYVHGEPNEQISSESRQELMDELHGILSPELQVEVIEQKAGVRAATKDRRPLVGQHPIYKSAYFLNGLGSRSVLMGPYLSEALADLICDAKPLHPDIDINRFFRKEQF